MSSVLDYVARRTVAKSGFAQARDKQLAYADPKAQLLGQVGDVDQGEEPYARFRIVTRDVDGSGDVMEPKGCLKHLDRFRRNPIWFYDHYAPDEQTRLKLPIGKADGPAGTRGELDIEVTDHEVILGCWFTQDTEEARDVYKLLKGGFLRSCSIAFLPVYGEKIPSTGGVHYIEWEPTEGSVVGVGDNAKANLLEVKSLESPRLRKAWSCGVTLEPAMPATKYAAIQFTKKLWTKEQVQKWLKAQRLDGTLLEDLDGSLFAHQPGCSAADWGDKKPIGKGLVGIVAKAAAKKNEDKAEEKPEEKPAAAADDTAKKDPPAEEKPAEGAKEVKKDEAEKDNDAPGVVPHGCGVLKDLYSHHKGVAEYNAAMKPHVEPSCKEIHKLMDDHIGNAQKHMDDIKNLATKVYPDVDFDQLTNGDAGDDERDKETGDNDQDVETSKTPEQKRAQAAVTKRINSKHKSVCKDAAEHLEEAAGSAPSKVLKSAHLYHAKALKDLLNQADTPNARPDSVNKDLDGDGDGEDESLQKALKSLQAKSLAA